MTGREDAPLFELVAVRVERGGRAVIDGLSARIDHGVTAVTGPSGAGKSTLLRLLDRLTEPARGEVRYRGRALRELPVLAHRREVVLVPQLPAPLPGTVADNLRFAARLAHREPDVDALLARVGLDPAMAVRDARRLSAGEGQRMMLARALALEPRVLLLDEPTASLDGEARDRVEAAVGELAAGGGPSVVLVTHDPEQAARLARHRLRLGPGGVLAGAGRAPGRGA